MFGTSIPDIEDGLAGRSHRGLVIVEVGGGRPTLEWVETTPKGAMKVFDIDVAGRTSEAAQAEIAAAVARETVAGGLLFPRVHGTLSDGSVGSLGLGRWRSSTEGSAASVHWDLADAQSATVGDLPNEGDETRWEPAAFRALADEPGPWAPRPADPRGSAARRTPRGARDGPFRRRSEGRLRPASAAGRPPGARSRAMGAGVTLQLGTLSLRNVRSYDRATLTFGPGVTVLTGDVGSGKTSLLHAVEMALFGFAEVDAPYLVRHRTGEAAVSLTLSDGEHSYELARTFRRRTRRGREVFDAEEPAFRVDGELRTYSLTEFRHQVIGLLGFPDNPNPRSRSDLWRWAVYTPQERMREVLYDDEADARLATIRKALGVERYHLAADNAEAVATEVRARARTHADVAVGMQHFETDFAQAETDLAAARSTASLAEAAASDGRRLAAAAEELLAQSETERRRRDGDRRAFGAAAPGGAPPRLDRHHCPPNGRGKRRRGHSEGAARRGCGGASRAGGGRPSPPG